MITLRMTFAATTVPRSIRRFPYSRGDGTVLTIIDVHAHYGWDYVFDEDFTLEEQLAKHADFGVGATILAAGLRTTWSG